jgi:hypothetical protein
MIADLPDQTDAWVRGDWMQTYSGGRFYPLHPRAQDINPLDIAHSLSLLCRFGGHIDRFYSVAEHCVLMSEAVVQRAALGALLHDATEAYVVDVPRPLKRVLPDYRAVEAQVWLAVAERFGLDSGELPEVKEADNRILLTERESLMSQATPPWYQDGRYSPLRVQIEGWSPEEAERRYLVRLSQLWEDK